MNPTLDKSTHIERVVPEQKLYCDDLTYEPGGGGINVARAVHKLGGEAQAIYTSGGSTGQTLRTLLDQETLNHTPIPVEDWTREGLTVSEHSSEQQYRFNMPGPVLKKEEWEGFLRDVKALDPRPDYIVASGSLPPQTPTDFYARLARFAQEKDIRLILDTSNQEAMWAALHAGVYLIKPNIREFRQLVNSELETEQEQESKAAEFVARGYSDVVVVSLGAAGVLLVTAEGCDRLRAPTVSIKSKVGAGDSTVGGLTFGLSQGKSLHEAVRFGVAAGAAAVTTPGTELCRLEDVKRLYAQISEN